MYARPRHPATPSSLSCHSRSRRLRLGRTDPRDSEEKLLRAFRTLDPENKGYVESDKIRTLLTTHGERFSQEEIDDFLHFAVDAETGLLHYEDYVMQVSV